MHGLQGDGPGMRVWQHLPRNPLAVHGLQGDGPGMRVWQHLPRNPLAVRGIHSRCKVCQATDRVCACGKAYRGIARKCPGCWRANLPCSARLARARAYQNTRRSRKRASEVAGPVSAEVYAAIASSGPCVYCGAAAAHVDHVRPLARGGWEHPDNLVAACAPCNQSKGSRLLAEWRPERVAYGVAHSPKVAAEMARLTAELAELAELAEAVEQAAS